MILVINMFGKPSNIQEAVKNLMTLKVQMRESNSLLPLSNINLKTALKYKPVLMLFAAVLKSIPNVECIQRIRQSII